MYSITVEHVFSAAHALLIQGVREPLHGHDWRVTVTLIGSHLDADGLLYDFHALHADLVELTRPFQNANLNDVPPFSGGVNPSAEQVAREIGDRLSDLLETRLARYPKTPWSSSLRIGSVRLTEAPGCATIYELPTRR